MFTVKDFLSMTDYFCFISTDGQRHFEVMSKNSKHQWKIAAANNYYTLFHAHNNKENYHLHGEFNSIFDCILEIVDHDDWELNVWRHNHKGKWIQPKTYFDKLVEDYAIQTK